MAPSARQVTSAHARQFHQDGWFVLDGALVPAELETLRRECGRLVAERDAEMTRLGVDTLDLCHRGRRYFLHAYATSAAVRRFLCSDLMVDLARAVLGDDVYLFNEQYVIKAPERGMPFGWHQDSGFIPYPHRPYLTCWIPLDDVSESNGTVHVLPYSRAGTRGVVEHHRDLESNDMIGYTGPDPGDALAVPAGSVIAFSSTLLPPHRPQRQRSSPPRLHRPIHPRAAARRGPFRTAPPRGATPHRRPPAVTAASTGPVIWGHVVVRRRCPGLAAVRGLRYTTTSHGVARSGASCGQLSSMLAVRTGRVSATTERVAHANEFVARRSGPR